MNFCLTMNPAFSPNEAEFCKKDCCHTECFLSKLAGCNGSVTLIIDQTTFSAPINQQSVFPVPLRKPLPTMKIVPPAIATGSESLRTIQDVI
jgi:hypothetical protein